MHPQEGRRSPGTGLRCRRLSGLRKLSLAHTDHRANAWAFARFLFMENRHGSAAALFLARIPV